MFCSSIWEPNGWGWEGRVSSSYWDLTLSCYWSYIEKSILPKGCSIWESSSYWDFLAPLPHWTFRLPLRFFHPLMRFWGYPHLHPHRLNSQMEHQMEQSPGFIYCKDVPGRTWHYWNNVIVFLIKHFYIFMWSNQVCTSIIMHVRLLKDFSNIASLFIMR